MSFCSAQTLTSQVRATKNSELPVLSGVGSGESNKDEGLVVCQYFFLLSIKREFGIADSTFLSDAAHAGMPGQIRGTGKRLRTIPPRLNVNHY